MQYSQTRFRITATESFVAQVLTQILADYGYESFEEPTDNELTAYIQSAQFDEQTLKSMIAQFPFEGVEYIKTELCEDKDWNQEWEKNYFQPIVIGKDLVIHSPFHKDIPKAKYDIVINPKMAFGTGHHQTTSLILQQLLALQLTDKKVLDMGCGTGVLGLMAAMRGASEVTLIDIDDWCTANAKENIILNEPKVKQEQFQILTGDAKLLVNKHFDVVLANINRNILLKDMACYAATLNQDGVLLISGFYSEDVEQLTQKATSVGLTKVAQAVKDNWTMLMFKQN